MIEEKVFLLAVKGTANNGGKRETRLEKKKGQRVKKDQLWKRIKQGKMQQWMGEEKKINNCHSDHCYLLGNSQKSSSQSGATAGRLSAGSSSTCSKVYKRRWRSRRQSKDANRRKREGLCEVRAKQVGSSSAAD